MTFALVVGFLAIVLRPRFRLARAPRTSSLRAIGAAFAHLGANHTTRTLVIALSGLNLAVGPAIGIGLALRAHDEGWGLRGRPLRGPPRPRRRRGAAAVARWRPRHEARSGFGALLVQGAGIVALGFGPVWTVAVAATVVGATAGYASVLLSATFAATVDTAFLGRMGSLTRLGDDCLMPLAMAGFGALATVTAVWVPFVVAGGAMTALMLVPLRARAFRTLSLRADG